MSENTSKTKARAVLLAAFGTSCRAARVAYDNVESAVKKALPGEEIRWAWSARSLLRGEGDAAPRLSTQEALARLAAEGFKEVYILSLHIIPGAEWNDLAAIAAAFEGLPKGLEKVRLCGPLLYGAGTTAKVAEVLLRSLPKERRADEAALFVGHGTHHQASIYYPALQYCLGLKDPCAFVGVLEGEPGLGECLASIRAAKARKVWLAPLLMVAGDHARNDLFGQSESWREALAAAGLEVEILPQGLGENPAIVEMLVNNLKSLLEAE